MNNETTSTSTQPELTLSHLERVPAWGGANQSISYVYRPLNIPDLQAIFDLARRAGRTLGFRGGGNSYGDAAMNGENILLDLRRFNRILAWDPTTGLITVEPGVTLQQLWEYILEDGWWPPVVTGTMKTTVGGCAAMNVHGKNAWQMGTIGDHILSFDLLLPSGEIITCSRDQHADIFHAAISGMGLLGCFTTLTLQMKRVYSGNLRVVALAGPNIEALLNIIDQHADRSDYIVGWVDATAKGKATGRGEIHIAHYLKPGEDPYPQQTLRLDNHRLPPNLFGIIPKSLMWLLMRPFLNPFFLTWVNRAKYFMAWRKHGHTYLQSHGAFHFLLDYIPQWKKAYGPSGLIQYQIFIPHDQAASTFRAVFELCQRRGLPNYLSVLKRHRPDPFLLTHGLDGFSMAMDFKVTRRNRQRLVNLARELDALVLAAGGRFYFAKDSTLRPEVARAYLGPDTLQKFETLRAQCDPNNLLMTDLWRRISP
ncbi:MAG TPA: FAD-binding oxidoreductase [Anaerolineae bacterium]|nr:FAD-binding oxidoreductase [Anaerolineae bacterium]